MAFQIYFGSAEGVQPFVNNSYPSRTRL